VSKKTLTVLAIVALIVILDQITKVCIVQTLELNRRIPVIDSFFDLTHLRNTGAAFSFLAQAPAWFRQPFFFIATAVAIVVLSLFLQRLQEDNRIMIVAVAGILGGAVGNLIDRILYGEVIDFLLFYWGEYYWPAFNVADSCITLGVIGLLWSSLRESRVSTPLDTSAH
jgi:signal peptidase II